MKKVESFKLCALISAKSLIYNLDQKKEIPLYSFICIDVILKKNQTALQMKKFKEPYKQNMGYG